MKNKMKEKKQPGVAAPVYYPLGEEIFSAITHGLGALGGIFALIYMLIWSARSESPLAAVASSIYGGSLIILYTISTLSHALMNTRAKTVFRVLDHATIFLLIAGTYTPITLITLKGKAGWILFGVQWALAAAGITFASIALNRFRRISILLYFIMGWLIITATLPLIRNMAPAGLSYLVGGGVFYTAGILFYRLRRPYLHAVMHLFTLIGSVLQFITVAFYVLPLTF